MTTWHSLWAFLFLIPLVAAVAWIIYRRGKRRGSMRFSSVGMFKKLPKTVRGLLAPLPTALKVVSIVVAIVALARPQQSDTKVRRNVEGIDIVLALDVSDSMLIEDMQPENRLEASKKTIKEFVEKRLSDRVGLVVFSGESYTRVPLTLDYELFQKSLSEVTTSRTIKMGTAIGVALANSVGRLKDSTAKSRVVIFLTDGENNSGTIDPLTAIDIAKGYDVRVYSIGMGVDGQARLPVYIQQGQRRIKQYRPIHSQVNENLLKKMADETGGKYYRATTSKALEGVFSEINQLEKTEIEVNRFTKYSELFPPYLYAAMFLYLFAFALGRTWLRRNP